MYVPYLVLASVSRRHSPKHTTEEGLAFFLNLALFGSVLHRAGSWVWPAGRFCARHMVRMLHRDGHFDKVGGWYAPPASANRLQQQRLPRLVVHQLHVECVGNRRRNMVNRH